MVVHSAWAITRRFFLQWGLRSQASSSEDIVMRYSLAMIALLAASGAAAQNNIVHLPLQAEQLDLQRQTVASLTEANTALKAQNEKLDAIKNAQDKQIQTLEKILQYQAAQLQIMKQQYDLLNQAGPGQ